MKYAMLILVYCALWQTGYAQHEHHLSAPASQTASAVRSPDKSSFPVVNTTLPVSRPQALAKTTLTGKRVEYDLVIAEQPINITGKPHQAITINGGFPGPTLRFRQGDVAVIRVHNKLNTETSVHWHGLLLPNKQDGVPYLNTPPIRPGQTHTFEFPLVQSGTFWFHSHTRYQEQLGVYGSIVIEPPTPVYRPDHDLVLLLSDWTNEKPAYILKNLKRRNEWYSIKKGNVQSLNRIIRHRAVGAYLHQSMQRMSPMDLSDVYYDRFLINGVDTVRYPAIKPGQTVRLRVINGSSSTYFHVNYGGGPMKLIAADGVDVQPVEVDRRLIGIAETYDFLVTVPANGGVEVRASAQDGSGYTTAWLGNGRANPAPTVPRPDLYKLTQNMSRMGGMHMGSMNLGRRDTTTQTNRMTASPMPQQGMGGMDHGSMGGMDHGSMSGMNHDAGQPMAKSDGMAGMKGGQMSMMDPQNTIDYSLLKTTEPVRFPTNRPIRDIPLTLTGNMYRYIWGFNGQPLSRADVLPIRRGEIVRIHMTNNTMMMHPIHLHGHYFRVLNGQGDYSPFKHTVNVSPMERVTIEFLADDEKDWFFHCHVLYHMLSGMARVVSYGDQPDSSVAHIQKLHLRDMRDNQPFVWGYVQPGYPINYFALNVSNNKNAIVAGGDHDWRTNNFEFDLDYEHYFSDWFRVFAGVDGGNERFLRRVGSGPVDPAGDQKILRPVAGIRYMLPFLIESEVKVDTRGNVRFQLAGQQSLIPRLDFLYQTQWLVGSYLRLHVELQYTLSKNLFLHTDYDTRYRTAGAGVGYNF